MGINCNENATVSKKNSIYQKISMAGLQESTPGSLQAIQLKEKCNIMSAPPA